MSSRTTNGWRSYSFPCLVIITYQVSPPADLKFYPSVSGLGQGWTGEGGRGGEVSRVGITFSCSAHFTTPTTAHWYSVFWLINDQWMWQITATTNLSTDLYSYSVLVIYIIGKSILGICFSFISVLVSKKLNPRGIYQFIPLIDLNLSFCPSLRYQCLPIVNMNKLFCTKQTMHIAMPLLFIISCLKYFQLTCDIWNIFRR